MKKIGKIILKALGGIVLAALVFVAGTSIYNRIKLADERKTLTELGYYNPVSVGDHALNVYRAGNGDGDHTFVTLSGWSDGEAFIGWRPMTSAFEDDNEFIFIDRPGYGLSDDVTEELTIPQVVEDYRTALHNSGEDGPYILLAHSLGGLYTAYWQSLYPDEVEGVILLDATVPFDDETWAEDFDFSWSEEAFYAALLDWEFFKARTGLARLGSSEYEELFYRLTDEEQELALAMVNSTSASHYAALEMRQFATGAPQNMVWNSIVTNDIPKVYVAASQYEDALVYADHLGNTVVYDMPGDHIVFLDQTEGCIDIITEFLTRIDG